MGFLGCCGAWKQSAWMLGTFFAFLFIIFLVEIGVGIMVYFHVSDMKIIQTMTDNCYVIRATINRFSQSRRRPKIG